MANCGVCSGNEIDNYFYNKPMAATTNKNFITEEFDLQKTARLKKGEKFNFQNFQLNAHRSETHN